jgi:hypothetical protein
MPTAKPRVSVTLSHPVATCLAELSRLTGNSQSALIGDLLAESLPVFERMVHVLSAAEKVRSQGMSIRDEVKHGLVETQERLETQLGLNLSALDVMTKDMLSSLEAPKRRAAQPGRSPTRAARSAATPISNRGVRFPKSSR